MILSGHGEGGTDTQDPRLLSKIWGLFRWLVLKTAVFVVGAISLSGFVWLVAAIVLGNLYDIDGPPGDVRNDDLGMWLYILFFVITPATALLGGVIALNIQDHIRDKAKAGQVRTDC